MMAKCRPSTALTHSHEGGGAVDGLAWNPHKETQVQATATDIKFDQCGMMFVSADWGNMKSNRVGGMFHHSTEVHIYSLSDSV